MVSFKLLGKMNPTFCQVLVVLYFISEKLFHKLLLHCRFSLKGHNIPTLGASAQNIQHAEVCVSRVQASIYKILLFNLISNDYCYS